ncbi:MAG TPA: exodeoxyribonuclease VII large subunit, partial [Dehalococcoidia bacterium]|nr:exodeoxyribonuclease VII large subunit [Dehalococcoidia bacterium]
FSLKDDGGVLRSVLFRDSSPGTQLKNGDRVLAHGKISIYVPRGDLQMICDFIRPEGVGIAAARLDQVKAKLEKEGLFEAARKRALPRFPSRIGLVTSPTGAALQDVRRVLELRWPVATLVIAPALVQGDQAVSHLLQAVEELTREPDLDFLVIARGGGSAEDLGAFNDEAVARAVFGSPVPVVSGLGHETDSTLTDLVADLRAPTPSAAIERSTPDIAEIRRALASFEHAGRGAAERRIRAASSDLAILSGHVQRGTPDTAGLLAAAGTALQHIRSRVSEQTNTGRLQLVELSTRVSALNPDATLARGFAIVELDSPDPSVVTSAKDVAPGDRIKVGVRDGSFAAEVRDDS